MVPAAPRYDRRLLAELRRVDDRSQPIAEVCRRVGEAAERLGLPRPSYVHVRRLVHAHRAREDAIRELVDDVASDLLTGRAVDVVKVLGRARELPPPPGR